MAASLTSLISLLSENERVLDDLASALHEEQRCIVDLDLKHLAENNSRKEQITARLGQFRDQCRTLLHQTGTELGCTGEPTLSTLVAAAPPLEQALLRPLQQRLVNRAQAVERQHENNRRILERSNGVINSTLSILGRALGGCDTYGAHGRVTSGMAGRGLVRREI